jgi:hypothetical protein
MPQSPDRVVRWSEHTAGRPTFDELPGVDAGSQILATDGVNTVLTEGPTFRIQPGDGALVEEGQPPGGSEK